MELVPLVCLCLLTWSGPTSADEGGPSVITVAVAEGRDAILPCSLRTKENIEQTVFDWKKDGQEVFLYDAGKHYNKGRTGQDQQFRGRVFHFEGELKYGNASIKVHNTKMADDGGYTCTFPGKQVSHIRLVVDPDPESFILKDRTEEKIPGAAPEPSIRILDETKDMALLQCVVRGASPKPLVQWQDSDGNILPAEEQVSERGVSYDIILKTTVTKTDHYYCLSTQEEISHQTKTETFLRMNESPTTHSIVIPGVVGFFVGVAVVFVVVVVVVLLKKCCKKTTP